MINTKTIVTLGFLLNFAVNAFALELISHPGDDRKLCVLTSPPQPNITDQELLALIDSKECYNKIEPAGSAQFPIDLIQAATAAERIASSDARTALSSEDRKLALGLTLVSSETRNHILRNYRILILEKLASKESIVLGRDGATISVAGTIKFLAQQDSAEQRVNFLAEFDLLDLRNSKNQRLEQAITSMTRVGAADMAESTRDLIARVVLPSAFSQILLASPVESLHNAIDDVLRKLLDGNR